MIELLMVKSVLGSESLMLLVLGTAVTGHVLHQVIIKGPLAVYYRQYLVLELFLQSALVHHLIRKVQKILAGRIETRSLAI